MTKKILASAVKKDKNRQLDLFFDAPKITVVITFGKVKKPKKLF